MMLKILRQGYSTQFRNNILIFKIVNIKNALQIDRSKPLEYVDRVFMI